MFRDSELKKDIKQFKALLDAQGYKPMAMYMDKEPMVINIEGAEPLRVENLYASVVSKDGQNVGEVIEFNRKFKNISPINGLLFGTNMDKYKKIRF